MARFLALTSRGLGRALHDELHNLGLKGLELLGSSVAFEASWKEMYRTHLQVRLATRILLPVLDFQAYNADDLYFALRRKHDFTKYIGPDQTIAIDASVTDHRELRDQRFVALKAKDAIVDQFREKFGERPNVDTKDADLRISVRVLETKVNVSVDLTGDALSYRGYRTQAGDAPLRENLAAGLVDLSDWDGRAALVDPMCGSGTVLIEAALKMRGGMLPRDKRFLFERLKNFDSEAYARTQAAVANDAKPIGKLKLYGYDKDPKVIAYARANAKRAGVDAVIHFEVQPVARLNAPDVEPGWLITNPPYAVRLGDQAAVERVWEDMAHTLKTQFTGWSCWLLSGNKDVTGALRLKTDRKIPLFNGPMECRFLHYMIH